MLSFNKILIPFDDQVISKGALEYAALIASNTGASITALFLANPKDYASKEAFNAQVKKMVDEQIYPKLEEVRLKYPNIHKIDLQIRGLIKPIYQHVLDFANENKVDFIVTRSHGYHNSEDWEDHLNNTNAYKIVLEAKCPVFTFTSIPESPKLKNILLPVDLSQGSLFKLPLVIELARKFNSTIHLLSSSEDTDEHADLESQLLSVHEDLQSKSLSTKKNKIEQKSMAEAIIDYTNKQNMDLVAIMSRPGFRWSDLWVSPKAKQILAQSKIPVLSIRSDKPLKIEV